MVWINHISSVHSLTLFIHSFIYSFSWRTFVLFPHLAIMSNATINIVHKSLCGQMLFISLGQVYINRCRIAAAATAAKSFQSCPTLRPHRWQPTRLPRPSDSPGKNTGVGFHFLLQCVKVKSLSRVWLLATPWTAAYQTPPSMGFSRQEYWSGLPFPSPTVAIQVS